jgi:hypothetical protein
VIACGDNRAAPDARPSPTFDGGNDGADNDAPDDGASGAPVDLTNLTPGAGTLRAEFNTPLAFSPDGTKVAVVANFTGTRDEPYVVKVDGSGFIRLVDLTACGTCDASVLKWTADGVTLFASGDMASNAETEAFKLDPTAVDQTPVLAADASASGDVVNLFVVDAGGGVSRVWAVGDWLTNNKTQAGGFASDATLPFSSGTQPTFVVPAGANEIFDGTGSTANEFDARGGKVAFVSDLTIPNRQDLYVANADGSSPTLLVTGVTGTTISSVSLSPDGTKVAYLQDSLALAGGFDLFVTTTGAVSLPTQLSPTRASASAALDVFSVFEWSADSKLIGFSADFTEDGFDQAYVVDTTQVAPAAVELLPRSEIMATAGTRGVRGKLQFDADNNIFFRARVTDGDFTFFKATPAGTKTTFALPARGDATTPDIGAFGTSPDGHTLVFSADSPTLGAYNLFAQAI